MKPGCDWQKEAKSLKAVTKNPKKGIFPVRNQKEANQILWVMIITFL